MRGHTGAGCKPTLPTEAVNLALSTQVTNLRYRTEAANLALPTQVTNLRYRIGAAGLRYQEDLVAVNPWELQVELCAKGGWRRGARSGGR